MFTGLIREQGFIKRYANHELQIQAKYQPKLGDSIAVNGVCLTVTRLLDDGFCMELSEETHEHIAVENLKEWVHLEPALKVGDALDGHMVQGHVDTTGSIVSISSKGVGVEVCITLPQAFSKYLTPKGSVAIDGVSLTLNRVEADRFWLMIIPHTWENTLFKTYKAGRRVNIETDMFARMLYHMFSKEKSLGWDEVDRMMAGY